LIIVPATPWAATRTAPTMGIVVDGIRRGIPVWVPLAGVAGTMIKAKFYAFNFNVVIFFSYFCIS